MRIPSGTIKTNIVQSAMAALFIALIFLPPVYSQEYEPNALLTVVRPNADIEGIKKILADLGASLAENHDLGFARLLKINTCTKQPPTNTIATVFSALSKNPIFIGVQPNWWIGWYAKDAAIAPAANDPEFPNQWNLFQMKLPGAWKATTKPTSQYIAFLDSGCHSVLDLSQKKQVGVSVIGNASPDTDDAALKGHGTKLASIAAASTNNRNAIAAVNPWAFVYPIKIGTSFSSDKYLILGLAQAIKSQVKVAVIGGGPVTPGWTFLSHPLVYGMLSVYCGSGGLAFAPAGNYGVGLNASIDPRLILVSSTDKSGQVSSFSNYGNAVWFAAPGDQVFAIDGNGKARPISGTCASAATVAGVASLIWSNNPNLSNKEVLRILVQNASKQGKHDAKFGYGIIDAQAAVNSSHQN